MPNQPGSSGPPKEAFPPPVVAGVALPVARDSNDENASSTSYSEDDATASTCNSNSSNSNGSSLGLEGTPTEIDPPTTRGNDASTMQQATLPLSMEHQEEGVIDETTVAEEQQQQQITDSRFEAGDHVYQWCSLMGIPGVFQHHGIVMHAEDIYGYNAGDEEVEDIAEHHQLLTIADFSNLLFGESSKSSSDKAEEAEEEVVDFEEGIECGVLGDDSDAPRYTDERDDGKDYDKEGGGDKPQEPTGSMPFLRSGSMATTTSSSSSSPSSILPNKQGGFRVYRTATSSKQKRNKWHKVRYQDHWFHTHLWKRSGTCTPASSDPQEVVLQRVQFLMSHSSMKDAGADNNQSSTLDRNEPDRTSILPPYHSIFSNCECVAVWCKTGTWSTLQAASFLSHVAVGQVKGTATLAGIAAAQTVSVPAAGVWGWMGYTSTVPLMTMQPLLLPAICAYGAISVGGPAVCLVVARKKWKETSQRLNAALEAETLQVSLVS